jgi:hypothetical protein
MERASSRGCLLRKIMNESEGSMDPPKSFDPDLCRNTMKYRNTHKRRDAAEIRLHFINNK